MGNVLQSIGAWVCSAALGIMGGSMLARPAAAAMGQPTDGQIGMQLPATPIAVEIDWFHNYVTVIIFAIALFVLGLMVYVVLRFNERANPTPSRFSHNTMIEVAWTVIPVLILVAIGIFSFKLLYMQYTFPPPDLTIKSTANAWFWEHEYPDEDDLNVTQNMVRDEDVLRAAIGDEAFDERFGELEGVELSRALYRASLPLWQKMPAQRQLATDNPIAVPVNKVVHVLVTSNDVIHGWAMPSFGSRVQAVPGRTTATWFKATKTGAFFGQCAVLCGQFHASMPIEIHVVQEPVYNEWLAAAKADDWERAKKILFDALPGSDTAKAVALARPKPASAVSVAATNAR
ncbi:MAG: cytochrome c oxidase subunit II [Pseudomonadota bacterium]